MQPDPKQVPERYSLEEIEEKVLANNDAVFAAARERHPSWDEVNPLEKGNLFNLEVRSIRAALHKAFEAQRGAGESGSPLPESKLRTRLYKLAVEWERAGHDRSSNDTYLHVAADLRSILDRLRPESRYTAEEIWALLAAPGGPIAAATNEVLSTELTDDTEQACGIAYQIIGAALRNAFPLLPQPESGSEKPLAKIADELRAYPEVQWDRFIEYDGKLGIYGWLARSDGRADFLLLDFDAATGKLLEWITSAHPHPASVVERLEGEESVECQRVEDIFEIPNAVRLQPESGSGEEGEHNGLPDHHLLGTALCNVKHERFEQERLKAEGRFEFTCADDGLSNAEKLAILTEEVGEVAQEVLTQEGRRLARDTVGTKKALRKELTQVAAVAVAWIESLFDADDQGAPTQPLQGSEVERLKAELDEMTEVANDRGIQWQQDRDRLQAQLQRVEGERDAARERLTAIRHQTVTRLCAERDQANTRATQAEARIQEAVEEFERRAKELCRRRDENPVELQWMVERSIGWREAANYLRSQSSSEVGEGPVEDCDDLCACGHERFAHMVNETEPGPCAERGCTCKGFSPGCPDCKQEERPWPTIMMRRFIGSPAQDIQHCHDDDPLRACEGGWEDVVEFRRYVPIGETLTRPPFSASPSTPRDEDGDYA